MLALFWFTVRQALLLRKVWLTLLLLAGPCAIALLVRHFGKDPDLEDVWERFHGPAQILTFMLVVPLVCILQGNALIGAEVEARTLVYLLTRKMRRATVLLVKYAAAAAVFTVLLELSLLALYACAVGGVDLAALGARSSLGPLPWQPVDELLCYLYVAPFAVMAYLALFTFISLVTARPLAASILFTIIVEIVVGSIPMAAQVYTLIHHLRATMFNSIPRLARFYDLSHEAAAELYPPGSTGTITVCVVTSVALFLACVLITTRELVPAKVARE